MRNLFIRLSEQWDNCQVFDWRKDVPQTNNGIKQAVGRMAMHSCTVQGFKSWSGMWAA
ncbi:MAG: hypothetical protein AB1345_07290 [Chloroflexota bacterium]